MGWISGLTGLSGGALLTIIAVAIIGNIPNIIKLIGVFREKKVKVEELSDQEKMMIEGEKALNDCKTLIIKNIPDSFNMVQRWVVTLMLYKAFNGPCKRHIRTLASRDGFGTMSDLRFEQYCTEEMPRVLRAVSDDMSDEWEGKEAFFPISRTEYEKNNYEKAGAECGAIVIKWFRFCRSILQREEGVA